MFVARICRGSLIRAPALSLGAAVSLLTRLSALTASVTPLSRLSTNFPQLPYLLRPHRWLSRALACLLGNFDAAAYVNGGLRCPELALIKKRLSEGR
jgi:hypothetical protein